MKKKAVVLLSGGLDSATTLAVAKEEGYRVYALSFRYGQRHACELEAARKIALDFDVEEHRILDLDLRSFGHSALTDDIDVPKDRTLEEGQIPVTYVPARNTIFLSFALAWAEVLKAEDVFLGVNALDYSGYPDCRPEYIAAFEALARLATKAGVEGRQELAIHAPLIDLTKAEIVLRAAALGVHFAHTHSCYDPDAACGPCGRCDACRLRRKGFSEAGIEDPLPYPPS